MFPGGLTSKVFAATPDNTGYVFYSQMVGHHINLPDVFDIEHAGEFAEGTYWATKVPLTIVNDTNTDSGVPDPVRRRAGRRPRLGRARHLHRRHAEQRGPGELQPPHGLRRLVRRRLRLSDVPDDLTLDFGFELA